MSYKPSQTRDSLRINMRPKRQKRSRGCPGFPRVRLRSRVLGCVWRRHNRGRWYYAWLSPGLRKYGRPGGQATGRSLYAKPDVGSLYTLIRFDPIEEIYLEFRCRGVNCQLV